MSDALRKFRCVTADGAEEVEIVDVLVWEETVYLLCKGERRDPYVFEISRRGMRGAHPDIARQMNALHQREVQRWQTTDS